MSAERSTTVGRERATNPALQFRDVQEFVLSSASVIAPRPPTTERVVALNRGPWVGLPEPLHAVDEAADAVVLDVRPVADFAAGHVPGALNVPVSGTSFGTKAAFVLPEGIPGETWPALRPSASRLSARTRCSMSPIRSRSSLPPAARSLVSMYAVIVRR